MTDEANIAEAELAKVRIVTQFVYPPIPIRHFDWQATYDGDEPDDEGRMETGHGETEAAAIHDLLANYPRSGAPCTSCKKPFFFGDTCRFGGCPNGGDV